MTTLTDTSIYIADLAAYNAGILRGQWVDADCEPEELTEFIKNMLLESPESNITCTVCNDCGHIDHYATLNKISNSSLAVINGWSVDNTTCEYCGSEDVRQTVTAEEYAIHDTNGLNVGEYESLEKVCELAQAIGEHGEAYQAYIDLIGSEYASVENFEESYAGEWDSENDFAEEYASDMGMDTENYFDMDSFTRDLFMDYSFVNGFVFRSI